MTRTLPARMTIFRNMDTGEYFFSTDHIQHYRSVGLPLADSWVPVSFHIPTPERPHHVVARPGIPDGLITTKEQFLRVFYADDKEIPNPDPKFQASWSE